MLAEKPSELKEQLIISANGKAIIIRYCGQGYNWVDIVNSFTMRATNGVSYASDFLRRGCTEAKGARTQGRNHGLEVGGDPLERWSGELRARKREAAIAEGKKPLTTRGYGGAS